MLFAPIISIGVNVRNKVGETPLDQATKQSLLVHSPSKQFTRMLHILEEFSEDYEATATDSTYDEDEELASNKPFYKVRAAFIAVGAARLPISFALLHKSCTPL